MKLRLNDSKYNKVTNGKLERRFFFFNMYIYIFIFNS
jgi:hypothetical protein